MGGELSKREGVLFHWWLFISKRNDRLQLVYTDIGNPNINVKTTITLLDIALKRCFVKFSFNFEGVLLAVRGCTLMFRGCSRTLKTPNYPPLAGGQGGNLPPQLGSCGGCPPTFDCQCRSFLFLFVNFARELGSI